MAGVDPQAWAWARAAVRRMLIAVLQRVARGDPLPGERPRGEPGGR